MNVNIVSRIHERMLLNINDFLYIYKKKFKLTVKANCNNYPKMLTWLHDNNYTKLLTTR
jgi:hypothetical protein